MMLIPELGQYGLLKPSQIEKEYVGTSNPGVRAAAEYGGFFVMSGEENQKMMENMMKASAVRPIMDPMKQVMEGARPTIEGSAEKMGLLFSKEIESYQKPLEQILKNAKYVDLKID